MSGDEPQPRILQWTPTRDPTSIIVPGVDTSASAITQIDQIDQLITIRLQNIDANFSKIQHLISSKLLPAFKRYAEGTEPVREAAKFWKSFYEAAAQVRIPVASESFLYPEGQESQEETSGYEEAETQDTSEHEANRTPINVAIHEDSFARGAPISSTPLVRDPAGVNLSADNTTDESWAASIESPFVRLGRQVKDLAIEDTTGHPSTSSAPSFSPFHASYTGTLPEHNLIQQNNNIEDMSVQKSTSPYSRKKGKSPLRQNVLRYNANLAAASGNSNRAQTPHRNKLAKNPFSNSKKWDGLVDLRQPSPARRTPKASGYDSDSSDDLFPAGMSPPITMQFAVPARIRSSPVKLTYSPAKKAAEKIRHDLVVNASSRNTGLAKHVDMSRHKEQSISSVAPSLPSLTRYTGKQYPTYASSTEQPRSMPTIDNKGDFNTPSHQIYRSRMDSIPQREPSNGGGPSGQQASQLNQHGSLDSRSQRDMPTYAAASNPHLSDAEGMPHSPGSDTDSDSEHGESNPSGGFIFATQNNARSAASDDSFASSQSDGDEDDGVRGAQHPLAHMFAGGPEGAEDSFDESFVRGGAEEETVFGGRELGRGGSGQLTLMGDPLIDATFTGAVSLNPFAQVEQSPTPYSGQAQSLERR